jgi:hypothetical protein
VPPREASGTRPVRPATAPRPPAPRGFRDEARSPGHRAEAASPASRPRPSRRRSAQPPPGWRCAEAVPAPGPIPERLAAPWPARRTSHGRRRSSPCPTPRPSWRRRGRRAARSCRRDTVMSGCRVPIPVTDGVVGRPRRVRRRVVGCVAGSDVQPRTGRRGGVGPDPGRPGWSPKSCDQAPDLRRWASTRGGRRGSSGPRKTRRTARS